MFTRGWVAAAVIGVAGLGATATEARADGFSFGIRIGGGHHHPRPVVVAPAPVVVAPPAGYWTTREVRVLVTPGHYQTRYIPAVTKVVSHHHSRGHGHGHGYGHGRHGRTEVIVVCPARYETVWMEPVYETRCERVWVPAPVIAAGVCR